MTEPIIEKVKELTLPILREQDIELFHLELKKSKHNWFLRVTLDKEGGINLGDCEKVSKLLSEKLDEVDLIPFSYTLEVSSPGLDRPLLSEEDYARFQGKMVRLKTSEAIDGQKNFKGRLAKFEEGIVTLEVELKKDKWKALSIPHAKIVKANLEIEL